MGAEAAEAATPALAPVVDDDLVHDGRERELDGAHRPVGHDQSSGLDPVGAQERLRLGQPSRLDDDVGAFDRLAPGVQDAHRLAERLLERLSEGLARLGAGARDANLLEVEERVQHRHVGERRAASADVAEHPRVAPGQMPRTERRHGAGSALGELGCVEDGARSSGPGVVKREQAELGRQAELPVAEEVADDLHPGDVERRHVCPEQVEVPVEGRIRHEVLARLEDDRLLPLRAHGGLDGLEHLLVRERELVDVRAREEKELDHGLGSGSGTAADAWRRSAGTAQAAITSAVSPTPR